MSSLIINGAQDMYPPSCLLSVLNVKYWPGKKNMCLCQKRHHYKKVTFETCSVSQRGTYGLCAKVSKNQKGWALQATPDVAEEGSLHQVKG